ncbi:hypothetical protein BURPS1710b_2565 [Burkholderia pseudomallei 1710b]|uniref:Uncharacterized protein n=1 Tax=Burkholderia pseudomallei (strain 1710b) TaxID=320372 RepID=Q3JR47_BURP1|nr:hypothetical protein BURPS1710b_2565 [Burkholderia pseudomallei 1710b]
MNTVEHHESGPPNRSRTSTAAPAARGRTTPLSRPAAHDAAGDRRSASPPALAGARAFASPIEKDSELTRSTNTSIQAAQTRSCGEINPASGRRHRLSSSTTKYYRSFQQVRAPTIARSANANRPIRINHSPSLRTKRRQTVGGTASPIAPGGMPVPARMIVSRPRAAATHSLDASIHASNRIHRLRRHRDHRRNLRAFDPVSVRSEIPARARAVHRFDREGIRHRPENQRRRAARRPQADRVHDARRRRIERDRQALERARARHVPALRRAARAGTAVEVEPRDGPRAPERGHRGIQDADRGDQLLARARRRPVEPQPRRRRRDPDRRVAQRQDADEPVSRDAVRGEGGELSADSGRLRARQAADAASSAPRQAVRPVDRSDAPVRDPQRAPPRQQVRGAGELPLRDQRGRSDDAARRRQVAVVDAQVDRGDRDDDPAGNQARAAIVLTTRRAARGAAPYRRRARHAPRRTARGGAHDRPFDVAATAFAGAVAASPRQRGKPIAKKSESERESACVTREARVAAGIARRDKPPLPRPH